MTPKIICKEMKAFIFTAIGDLNEHRAKTKIENAIYTRMWKKVLT
ncbi:hypothetical protein [Neobacillus soli]|nr:hypothetical protein [Neobacillus soli]